eukprot:ctg_276.g180
MEEGPDEELNSEFTKTERPKVSVSSASKNVVTVHITGEDHTLGNLLRYLLAKHKDVEFAGYNIPHPSENLLNLRIQAKENVDCKELVVETLKNLKTICDVLESKYRDAVFDPMEISQP